MKCYIYGKQDALRRNRKSATKRQVRIARMGKVKAIPN